jgi:exopolysaccharide biosynthesis operon protein EpsL
MAFTQIVSDSMFNMLERLRASGNVIKIKSYIFSSNSTPLAALLLLCTSFSARADLLDDIKNQDTFHPYLSTSITYDDNLFRLEKNVQADTMFQAAAGVSMDWKVARQHFILNLAINDNKFDRHKSLDYIGTDVQARWNWQLGNHINGDVGYSNSLTLGSFVDQQNTTINNQRTQERLFYNAKWLFHPSWQLGMGASKSTTNFADSLQRYQNRDETIWNASLDYLDSSSSKLGIRIRESDYYYPNHQLYSLFALDDGYYQHDLMTTIDWAYTAKTRLKGEAGIVKKEGRNFSAHNYLGFNTRGTFSWMPTTKTKLNFSAWRAVSNNDDLIARFTLNHGVSLESFWIPTSKITLSGKIQHETRDFMGNTGLVSNTSHNRKDSQDIARLALTYRPIDNITLNVNVSGETRHSNEISRSYDDASVGFSATFEM